MQRTTLSRMLTAVAVTAVALMASPAALAQDDAAKEAILKKIYAQVTPTYNAKKDKADPEYRAQFIRERGEVVQKRCDLIGELFAAYPTADETAELIDERWRSLANTVEGRKMVDAETSMVIKKWPEHRSIKEAYYWNAASAMYGVGGATDQKAAVKRGIDRIANMQARFPDDARVATLTYQLAAYYVTDDDQALALLKKLKKEYPESREAKRADGKILQYESVGKPFELAFTDAISGTEISMQQLRGKVVVIDFWATWCGPCVAEMPNMKKWYAQFKPQGVEFLGISLDSPRNEEDESKDGLAKLKNFVEENDIQWPQFYQGNGWQSEFSSSWGINSIPSVFIVDADGNLFSISARGKLEELIPELIAKRDGKAGG